MVRQRTVTPSFAGSIPVIRPIVIITMRLCSSVVEQGIHKPLVTGSSPVRAIPYMIVYASLVQLVERRSPKPDVVGSNPTGREFFAPIV